MAANSNKCPVRTCSGKATSGSIPEAMSVPQMKHLASYICITGRNTQGQAILSSHFLEMRAGTYSCCHDTQQAHCDATLPSLNRLGTLDPSFINIYPWQSVLDPAPVTMTTPPVAMTTWHIHDQPPRTYVQLCLWSPHCWLRQHRLAVSSG